MTVVMTQLSSLVVICQHVCIICEVVHSLPTFENIAHNPKYFVIWVKP